MKKTTELTSEDGAGLFVFSHSIQRYIQKAGFSNCTAIHHLKLVLMHQMLICLR